MKIHPTSRYGLQVAWKIGAFQEFVHANGTCGDYGPSVWDTWAVWWIRNPESTSWVWVHLSCDVQISRWEYDCLVEQDWSTTSSMQNAAGFILYSELSLWSWKHRILSKRGFPAWNAWVIYIYIYIWISKSLPSIQICIHLPRGLCVLFDAHPEVEWSPWQMLFCEAPDLDRSDKNQMLKFVV